MYVFSIVLFSARPSLPQIAMGILGFENKIQAKKLVMASRRLAKQSVDHPPGTAFDSSDARGANYSFVLGRGRVVRAMDLAVRSMRVGELSTDLQVGLRLRIRGVAHDRGGRGGPAVRDSSLRPDAGGHHRRRILVSRKGV